MRRQESPSESKLLTLNHLFYASLEGKKDSTNGRREADKKFQGCKRKRKAGVVVAIAKRNAAVVVKVLSVVHRAARPTSSSVFSRTSYSIRFM